MNEKQTERVRKLSNVLDGISQPLVAVVISLVIGAIVIVLCDESVSKAYGSMLYGAFGKTAYIIDTLKRATPIIMGGLAVCVAWRSGFEAMGGEGQMIFGALCSALVAYYVPAPAVIRIILAVTSAIAIGAVYSVLAGWLYDRFHVTFIISTLMLNYIANNIASYMTNFVVRDPEATDPNAVQTGKIVKDALLQPIAKGSVNWAFVITIVIAIVCFIVFKKTTFGYNSRMSGLNPRFARYGGIKPRRMLYIVMIISGALAGLGGAFEVLGAKGRYVDQMIFTTGYAWSGMVAALLANFHPLGTALASVLLAALATGGSNLQFDTKIPLEVSNVIQGIIMLLMSVKLVRFSLNNILARRSAAAEVKQ